AKRDALDGLANRRIGPTAGAQAIRKDPGMTPEDNREVHAHPMRIVRDQESELDGHVDLPVETVHVDFPHASGRIEARNETALLGETIEIQHVVSPATEDFRDRTLPGPGGPGERDEHGRAFERTILRVQQDAESSMRNRRASSARNDTPRRRSARIRCTRSCVVGSTTRSTSMSYATSTRRTGSGGARPKSAFARDRSARSTSSIGPLPDSTRSAAATSRRTRVHAK